LVPVRKGLNHETEYSRASTHTFGHSSSAIPLCVPPLVEMLESRVVPPIDHGTGFARPDDLQNTGSAIFTGSVARITDGNSGEAGSIFTKGTFDITRFSTSFTFLLTQGSIPIADGFAFTIQHVSARWGFRAPTRRTKV
jgi:hypothetical protein